jgi:low temperature requirement protein LtrA
MASDQHQPRFLRQDGEHGHRVTPMELFFDLVYVFAITQLSHLLLEHLDIHGSLQTALLLLAVWWAWMYTAWATNWFDPNQRSVRLVLVGVMVGSLIMSATIPEAFGDRGLFFAGAYVAMQVGRTLAVVYWTRDDPGLHRTFQRILFWFLVSGVFWIAGALVSGTTRELLWLVAVGIDLAAPAAGFFTPGLGRSTTHEWNISGEHLAERCQLFLIIALGESILVTGATFGEMEITAPVLAGFVVAFLGSVALWWVYFDRSAEEAAAAIARSEDPGALGRSAYTYLHLPMVAGIIVTAVGDELAIAHPLGHASPETVATVLGGPTLFLAGHALFKKAVFGVISVPRLAAIGLLGIVALVGSAWAPLALATCALVIIAGVAWWDTRTVYNQHPALATTRPDGQIVER